MAGQSAASEPARSAACGYTTPISMLLAVSGLGTGMALEGRREDGMPAWARAALVAAAAAALEALARELARRSLQALK